MDLTIKINMDNAAFEGRPNEEVSRILRELAERIALQRTDLAAGDGRTILDVNGNKVGSFDVS